MTDVSITPEVRGVSSAKKDEDGASAKDIGTSKQQLPSSAAVMFQKIQGSLASAGEAMERVADKAVASASAKGPSEAKTSLFGAKSLKKTGEAIEQAMDSFTSDATKLLRRQTLSNVPEEHIKGSEAAEESKAGDMFEDQATDSFDRDSSVTSAARSIDVSAAQTTIHEAEGSAGRVLEKAHDETQPLLSKGKTTAGYAAVGSHSIETHHLSLVAVAGGGLLFLFVVYSTSVNLNKIWTTQEVPLLVASAWPFLAFLVGLLVGGKGEAKEELPTSTTTPAAASSEALPSSTSTTLELQQQLQEQQRKGATSSFLQRVNERFEDLLHIQPKSSSSRRPLSSVFSRSSTEGKSTTPWTTLGNLGGRKRLPWEKNGYALVSKGLVDAILHGGSSDDANEGKRKHVSYRRCTLTKLGVSQQQLDDAILSEDATTTDVDHAMQLGSLDQNKICAKSLEDEVVEPMCPLRGVDVFLTDNPESDLAEHPFLIEHGLRDRPTFVINALSQWGNIAIYFELPAWIKDWDDIVENEEDDPEDVVALKRFLNGDDEYRKLRFKCLPCLVDGPAPIRFMEPPRKAVTAITPRLPGRWTKHAGRKVSKGGLSSWLHPCLELELDLMADRTMRSIASLVKRYLVTIVTDAAILIDKPNLQEEEEPRACLGMCRFDRVDIATCPELPPRLEAGQSVEGEDLWRASVLVGKPIKV